MKFLNVFCNKRKTTVYVNLEKIVLITSKLSKTGMDTCNIEVEGLSDGLGAIEVQKPASELIKMINGDDKTTIGFRTDRSF